MFQGIDSNAMLQAWQDVKGRFPNRMVKRHILSYGQLEKAPHFEENFQFRQQTTDKVQIDRYTRQHPRIHPPTHNHPHTHPRTHTHKVTGKGVLRMVDVSAKPVKDLRRMLMSSKAGADDQKLVLQLADLIDKVLNLDPEKRMTVGQALKHPWSDTTKGK